jgi:HrpA-like RNA helicase
MSTPTLLERGNLTGAIGERHPNAIPVEYITGWLKARMPEFGGGRPTALGDRVLAVRAKTGSGKSTVMPVHIFRLLRPAGTRGRYRGQSVICTQPRVLTAQTLARDIGASPHYPDMVLGETVGYKTGPVTLKPPDGLIYATAGVLAAQMRVMSDDEVAGLYRFIIIDEAHERQAEVDALLMRLKAFLRRNLGKKTLPFIILTSATFSAERVAEYFEAPDNVVDVRGRAEPIREIWPAHGTNNYPAEAARVVAEIHSRYGCQDSPGQCDILVFMPGAAEIAAVRDELLRTLLALLHDGKPGYLVLTLTREDVTGDTLDYRLIKERADKLRYPPYVTARMPEGWDAATRPSRRVIVATVVAETGVTIETLKYVVDCGWSRTSETYFPGGETGLVTRPASRSRLHQRAGRTGRLFPGEYYPLFTKNTYNALDADQAPAIVTEGCGAVFMDVVTAQTGQDGAAGPFDVRAIDMLDTPAPQALARPLELAVRGGWLEVAATAAGRAAGATLTPLGQIAAMFDMTSLEGRRVVLGAFLWRVAMADAATLAALLSWGRDLRQSPLLPAMPKKYRLAEAMRLGLPDHVRPAAAGTEAYHAHVSDLLECDFIETLAAFEGFVRALDTSEGDLGAVAEWCASAGVELRGALELASRREKVMGELTAAGVNPFWGDEWRLASASAAEFGAVVTRLKRCLYGGIALNTLTRDSAGKYRTSRGTVVKAPSRLTAGGVRPDLPHRVAVSHVEIRGPVAKPGEQPPPLLYTLSAGMCCVLDGSVPVDDTLAAPWLAGEAS